jgi:deoxyhypusine synthase
MKNSSHNKKRFPAISNLKTVQKTKLYQQIATQIQELIEQGKLKHGDQLPPERELAEIFQVSRHSVREAFRTLEEHILEVWKKADAAGERRLPHEYFYELIRSGVLDDAFQIDPEDSWLVAAARRDLPLFVPGWEDSTMGNILAANVLRGELSRTDIVGSGIDYMLALADWYLETTMGAGVEALLAAGAPEGRKGQHGAAIPADEAECTVGFFQVGGGIAGDFPICVVPLIHQDLELPCPYWGYFCQISDSTTSYGSYSGATPTEKITWGKLDVGTPMFVIESDATIVAPLIFGYLLDW